MTIKDIAKKAGVSDGTVDRVIHNRGGVSKRTEEKIRKILEENNFKINPIASALAMKKRYHISSLLPTYDEQNPFWKSPYMGMLKAHTEVENFGIHMSIHTYEQDSMASYLEEFEALLKTNPDVVILVPVFREETKKLTKRLEALNIDYMFLNIDLDNFNNISFIGQDSTKAGKVAGKLMKLSLKEGDSCVTVQTHAKIGDYNTIYERTQGFDQYLEENDPTIERKKLKLQNLGQTSIVSQKVNALLAENPNIKGIYVPSSRASIIAQCLEPKFHDQVYIIGFDTTPPNVECLRQNKIHFLISQKSFNQGYEAVRVLTNFLIHKKAPEKKIYSPIQIIVKENLEFSNRNKESFQNEHATLAMHESGKV